MRALLDTHSFLWFILDDPQLSASALQHLKDPANEFDVSPATYWEIAIKINLRKFSLPEPDESFMESHLAGNDFNILPILPRNTALLVEMPLHHRDPFDRLLVAQALVEEIPIISADRHLDAYAVERIW